MLPLLFKFRELQHFNKVDYEDDENKGHVSNVQFKMNPGNSIMLSLYH